MTDDPLTPDEFLALQKLRQDADALISEEPTVLSLEEKGFIVRERAGWAVTDLGEKRFRAQTGDDARQR